MQSLHLGTPGVKPKQAGEGGGVGGTTICTAQQPGGSSEVATSLCCPLSSVLHGEVPTPVLSWRNSGKETTEKGRTVG